MTSLTFIVESGTDARLVEGLAQRFDLSVLARRIVGGTEISQPTSKPMRVLVGPESRFNFAVFVWKHLRAHRQEIHRVIVQGYGLAALAANLAGRMNRITTAMLVCSPVEAYYRCRKAHPEEDKQYKRRELFALKVLARLNALMGRQYVVLSDYLASVVRRHGARSPIAVIPVYGIDTTVFSPASEPKTNIKARLGLPTTGALIFFSSRVAPEKDSETLLDAMRILLNSGRDLWLLHRSGAYQTFAGEAERFGVGARVIATDAVHPHKQLPLDYQAADLCVQASREEGLGFSPLEALASGVPVIASAVGGLKETIRNGETGWTYSAGDAEALAKCIEAVLDNPTEAVRRTAIGREMVLLRYDQRVVFELFDDLMLVPERSELKAKLLEVR
jgi:glycosyltransferase involved in cell wall biosynthesis